MKAFVLCAGYGTRLGGLTERTPKPMLDVGGQPMLGWVLHHLRANGFTRIGLNLHFHGETIRSWVGDGSRLGLDEVRYFEEPELLGTAGALRNASSFLSGDEPFLVQYGDVVTDHDLASLAGRHREHGAAATMLVHERREAQSVAVIAADGRVTRFVERPSAAERTAAGSSWSFSAICMIAPEALRSIPHKVPSDLPADLFGELVAARSLYAEPLDGYRVAVDSPARLAELRSAIADGRCRVRRG